MYGLLNENVENNLRNWQLLRILVFKSYHGLTTYTVCYFWEPNDPINFTKVETMISLTWEFKTTVRQNTVSTLKDEIKWQLDFIKDNHRELVMNKKA